MHTPPPKRPAQSNAFSDSGNPSFEWGHTPHEQVIATKPHIPTGTNREFSRPFCGWCLR
jgi:hypothetical protein